VGGPGVAARALLIRGGDRLRGRVVRVDEQRRGRRAVERGAAGRIAERQEDRLHVLDGGVVDDRNREGLGRLAVGEGQPAALAGAVAAGRGGAVAGRVVDGHAAGAAVGARHRDDGRRLVLNHAEGGGTETQQAGLAGRVGGGHGPREAGAVLVLPGVAA